MPTTPLAELAYDVRIACMRLVRRVRYNTEALPPHFFTALAAVERGGETAAELAARERVSAPAMSRTISELNERGYITRAVDPDDRRRQLLTITEAGAEALHVARRQRDQWMVERLTALSPEELDTLRRAATIIDDMLDDQ